MYDTNAFQVAWPTTFASQIPQAPATSSTETTEFFDSFGIDRGLGNQRISVSGISSSRSLVGGDL